MKKNTILTNITVEKLVFGWKWFARLVSDNPDTNGKTLFISWWVIPGSIVNVRVLRSRKDYIETQLQDIITPSPYEHPHPNNPYGKQAGMPWINIAYDKQLDIKQNQVKEALFHLDKLQTDIPFHDIIPSPLQEHYRNKIEFSFGKYISAKERKNDQFNVWFHKQGEFSKIEDFDGTILISKRANAIYKEIKDFTKSSGFPVYDTFNHTGFYRHIVLREAFFSDEIMIILGINHSYPDPYTQEMIEKLRNFLTTLSQNHPIIQSVYLSLNDRRADIALWKLKHIYGKEYITEELLGLKFNISPQSFFQTNSHGAQTLYEVILDQIDIHTLQDATVLDLYGGTGTIGMVFAKYAKSVISVEMVESASKDGEKNAKQNNLTNISFVNKKVEDFLWTYLQNWQKADLLILDPPRTGMHPDTLPHILSFQTPYIIYVSCNPATLARDLEYILKNSTYRIKQVTPVDMFPHTHHIETVVLLEKK